MGDAPQASQDQCEQGANAGQRTDVDGEGQG
jgi:hypothetical protein